MAKPRGGYGSGQFRYTETVKMRITSRMYEDLLKIQESSGLSMAQLLRDLVNQSMKGMNENQVQ